MAIKTASEINIFFQKIYKKLIRGKDQPTITFLVCSFFKTTEECEMKIKIDEAFWKLDSFYSKLKVS